MTSIKSSIKMNEMSEWMYAWELMRMNENEWMNEWTKAWTNERKHE